MFKLIDKIISNFYTKKIKFVYILFLLLVAILSIIFTYHLILMHPYLFDANNKINLYHIPFGYGPLIENLYNGNGYHRIWNGVETYLSRLPFLPIFVSNLYKVSKNIYIFLIIKNLIFFSIYFYFSHQFCKFEKKSHICFIIINSIIFYNFYNLTTNLNFFFGDAFIGIVLPSIFIILNSNLNYKEIFTGLLLFCVYLMKTTMLFPTLTIAILYFIFEKNSKILKRLIPLIFLSISIISWGSFGYIKTGIFSIGPKLSSDNQQAFAIVMNKDFHKFYPKISVDLIPTTKVNKIFKDEWDTYNFYKELNSKYIEKNKDRIFKDTLIKLKFIFFNIRKDSVHPKEGGKNENPILFSHIFNRTIAITSLILSMITILKNLTKIMSYKLEIYYLGIFFTSILPHIIGWATSKHLVAISIISHLYLFFKFKNYLK